MKKVQNRKYGKTYVNLRRSLKSSGFDKSGTTATLLLNTFIHNSGALKAGQVVALGLCEEGGFKNWRDNLVKAGFLQPWSHGDYSRHHCGPNLLKYVNEAKLLLSEVASRRELEALEIANKKDFESTRTEVEKLRKELREETAALRKMIEIHIQATNPPVNDEKVDRCLKIVKDDDSSSSGNDLNEMFPVNIQ